MTPPHHLLPPTYHTIRYEPVPNKWCSHALLAIVWSMRARMHEAVTMGVLFPHIMEVSVGYIAVCV
jgi:hypothetical protein